MHLFGIVLVQDDHNVCEEVQRLMEPFYEREWDWYQIGGRWTGAFDPDYAPENDPANLEPCPTCASGTPAEGGFATPGFRLTPSPVREPGDCPRCGGTGQSVKWPTFWRPFNGDVKRVRDIGPQSQRPPYFVVTPEGQWLTHAGTCDQASWDEQFATVMTRYPDCFAVVVDAHT